MSIHNGLGRPSDKSTAGECGFPYHSSVDQTLELLKNGIRKFQTDVYCHNADAYRAAVSRPQKPHTLIVTCADSRVDIETITSAGPGEVFVARNVGNMIPAYGDISEGVGAVIEYAVDVLKVKHIVVCGHSDCGAMKALLNPPPYESMPYISRWLMHGRAALAIAGKMHELHGGDLMSLLTEQNVLTQLNHLRTHPHVAGAIAHGDVTISGWVYDIGLGDVRIFEDGGPAAFATLHPGEQT